MFLLTTFDEYVEKYSYLKDHFLLIGLTLFVLFFILLLARKFGFFKLAEENRENAITVANVVEVFAIYFGAIFVVVPAVAYGSVYLLYGYVPSSLEDVIDLVVLDWLNLLTIVFSVVSVILYSLMINREKSYTIWNVNRKGGLRLARDFLIGASIWIISFPTVIIIDQIVDILVTVYFNIQHPMEEQVAVNYIKGVSNDIPLVICASFTVIVLVPMAEEIMFRGIVQNWFKQTIGRMWAIVVTSLFFSAMHFSQSQGKANFELLTSLFVLSLFLGYIYERQRSLWASIGLHSTFNAMSIALILLKE
jgi:membrane protease YdiL (CAAX protease family)